MTYLITILKKLCRENGGKRINKKTIKDNNEYYSFKDSYKKKAINTKNFYFNIIRKSINLVIKKALKALLYLL